MSKQKRAVKLEEKVLEFEFEINQVQFNKSGTYFLKLSIENYHRRDLLPQVVVETNNSGNNAKGHSTKTDSVLWDGSQQFVRFNKNRFRFRLPKGFCKNDLNYDVYLMIEASLQRINKRPEHVGEARVAIYPRTDAPKANLMVKRGQDYYHYASVLTLLRPSSRATISMHCGRLSYSIAFREFLNYDRLLRSDTSDDETEFSGSKLPSRLSQSNKDPKSPPDTSARSSFPKPTNPPSNKIEQLPDSPPTRLPQSTVPRAVTPEHTDPRSVSAPRSNITPPSRISKPSSPRRPRLPSTTQTAAPRTPSTVATQLSRASEVLRAHNERRNDRNPEIVDSRNGGGLEAELVESPAELNASIPPNNAEVEEVYRSYLASISDDVISPQETQSSSPASFRLGSAGSFHLSLPETPIPIEPPTYREKTMDQPSNGDSSTPGPTNGRSPTITSPRASSFVSSSTHVAPPGFQEVVGLLHGATSLPSPSDGGDPIPFVTMKSRFDEEGNRAAQASSSASLSPTHSPRWEELLIMKVPDGSADEEEVIVTVADSRSKEKLVTYRFPLANLVPFHPYHFEFIQPTSDIPAGVRLFITLQRRHSHLPRLESFGFCALEVALRDFQYELSDPPGPLIALLRIVPDFGRYKSDMLSRHPLPAGLSSSPITFPSPNPTSFAVLKRSRQGHPQITLPSKQGLRPEWNQPLLFTSSDTATIFSPNSALVIELYASATLMSSVTWNIRNPVGFCTVLLNDEVYRAVTSDEGRMGVRVDDLLIQGSKFVTREGVFPSLRLTMRLITTERPDALVAVADADILPQFDFIPTGSRPTSSETDQSLLRGASPDSLVVREETPTGGPPLERKTTRFLVKEDEFPPSDAIREILPEYVMTESDVRIGAAKTAPVQDSISQKKSTNQKPSKDGRQAKSLLDHQAQELEKYREAVKKMSSDIVSLRRSITQLQEENALLRRELLMNKEVGQGLMDDLHRGVISSGEVADKFVAVNQQLAKESEDLKKYRGKVQNLQNQMIKANEREKGYLRQSAKKKELEANARHLEDKVKKERRLEETCVQQEKVIKKMERLLSKYMEGSKQAGKPAKPEERQSDSSMLAEENTRLRLEVESLKAQQERSEADRAELTDRIRRAEHRTSSLEAQLDHNARTWAKERHELTVRLQEHRNGIVRSTDPLL